MTRVLTVLSERLEFVLRLIVFILYIYIFLTNGVTDDRAS